MAWDQLAGFCSMQTRDCCLNQDFNSFLGPSKINSEPDFSPKLSQKKRLVPRVTTGPQQVQQLDVYHLHGSHCRRAVLFCHPLIGTRGTLRLINFSFIFPVSSDSLSRHTAPRQRCDDRFLSARVRGNPLLRAHTS